jgi:hypothetical protein
MQYEQLGTVVTQSTRLRSSWYIAVVFSNSLHCSLHLVPIDRTSESILMNLRMRGLNQLLLPDLICYIRKYKVGSGKCSARGIAR